MAKILNLGTGNRPIEGAVNHDVRKHNPTIDVTHDLSNLPWPWGDEEFDTIHAISVLEHLDIDLVGSVDECWRILKPGGKLIARVPHWQHPTCWRDPTHRRGYTMETWDLFDPRTHFGKGYGFYTERKWHIEKREPIYLRGDHLTVPSSVEVVMVKVVAEEKDESGQT